MKRVANEKLNSLDKEMNDKKKSFFGQKHSLSAGMADGLSLSISVVVCEKKMKFTL